MKKKLLHSSYVINKQYICMLIVICILQNEGQDRAFGHDSVH